MKTLKQQYKQKLFINELSERLSKADEKLQLVIEENKKIDLILEDFNQEQMKQATDLLKKLKSINFSNLEILTKARDAAINDVTAALSGSEEKGLIRKIVTLFTNKKENPLIDAIAFTDAIQNFFSSFSQYANSIAGSETEKTVSELITGKTKDELEDLQSVNKLGSEEKKKLDNIKNLIYKGFRPEGKLANISKNWIDKYLGGKKGLDTLANQIISMKAKDLKSVINTTTETLKTVDNVGQAVAAASEKSATPSSPTTGSEETTTTSSTQKTKSTSKQTAEKPATVQATSKEEKIKLAAAALKKAKFNQETVKKVITTLVKNNLI